MTISLTRAELDSNTSSQTTVVERLLVVFLLLAMWTPNEANGASVSLQVIRYGLFLTTALSLTAFAIRMGRPLVGRSKPEVMMVVAFVGYAVVSSAWAPPSWFSYAKAALLLASLSACFTVSSVLPLSTIIRGAMIAAMIFVWASISSVVLFPSIAIEDAWGLAGKWRGLAGQKNELGAIASIALICTLTSKGAARPLSTLNILRALSLIAAVLVLIMSGSRGAQLSFAAGMIFVVFAVSNGQLKALMLTVLFLVGIPVAASLAGGSSFDIQSGVLALLGVEVDTSSRLLIWNYGLSEIEGHEVFGVGLGGFWTSERVSLFLRSQGWVLDNFHNGFVSAFVELGLVGLLMSVLMFATIFARLRVVGALAGRRPELVTGGAIITMFLFSNLVENWLIRSTSFYLLVFMLIALSLRRVGWR